MGNNSCNRLALPVISGEYKTFPVIGKKMFNMIILKKFFDFFPVIRSPDCKNLDGSNTKINKTEKR